MEFIPVANKEIKQTIWTHFWDLRIGICSGSNKDWLHVYIEAPKEMAKKIFQSRFGYVPDKHTCVCMWNDDYTIKKYEEVGDTLFIRSEDWKE